MGWPASWGIGRSTELVRNVRARLGSYLSGFGVSATRRG
jgi:hypothetical protein